MNRYPEYIKIDGKEYKINTDFRIAIECNQIAEDDSIGDFERVLAIIYKLFGDEAINTPDHYEKLLRAAEKYLLCGKEKEVDDEIPDMDYVEDYNLIWASIYSDYSGLDIDKEQIHWWKFNDLVNGLSNGENGCVFNRVRDLRNYDTKEIDDKNRREKIEKAKESVALKKYKKENNLTKEQEASMDYLNKVLGL